MSLEGVEEAEKDHRCFQNSISAVARFGAEDVVKCVELMLQMGNVNVVFVEFVFDEAECESRRDM